MVIKNIAKIYPYMGTWSLLFNILVATKNGVEIKRTCLL